MIKLPSLTDFVETVDGTRKINYKMFRSILKEMASVIEPSEYCQEASEHFKLFHNDTHKDRYVCFFFNMDELRWQINLKRSTITEQVLTAIVALSHAFHIHTYISEFCYITGKSRKEDNVCGTNVITLDLDRKGLDIHSEMANIQKICEDNELNLTTVMSSGRGHYLVFALDQQYLCIRNEYYLKRWKVNYDRICDLFTEYEADYHCKDISRVFRLMGTINYKDNTEYQTSILYSFNKTNHYNSISLLQQAIPTKDSKKKTKKDSVKRTPDVKIDDSDYLKKEENSAFKFQNRNRIDDLIKLLNMRSKHVGDRHAFLYVFINQLNAMGYSYSEAYAFLIKEVNTRFSKPEKESEIIRQLNSIYQKNKIHEEFDGFKNVQYVDNDYHCLTTAEIINQLNITEFEQENLTVLKSKETLYQLRQNSRLTKLRCATQNRKKEAHNSINNMTSNCSIEEIMEEKNITRSTVYRKLDKTPKQIKKEQENALIVELHEKGVSIKDIAADVGLSYEVVKKRLQRMKTVEKVQEVVEENTTEEIVSIDDNTIVYTEIPAINVENLTTCNKVELLDTGPPIYDTG